MRDVRRSIIEAAERARRLPPKTIGQAVAAQIITADEADRLMRNDPYDGDT